MVSERLDRLSEFADTCMHTRYPGETARQRVRMRRQDQLQNTET